MKFFRKKTLKEELPEFISLNSTEKDFKAVKSYLKERLSSNQAEFDNLQQYLANTIVKKEEFTSSDYLKFLQASYTIGQLQAARQVQYSPQNKEKKGFYKWLKRSSYICGTLIACSAVYGAYSAYQNITRTYTPQDTVFLEQKVEEQQEEIDKKQALIDQFNRDQGTLTERVKIFTQQLQKYEAQIESLKAKNQKIQGDYKQIYNQYQTLKKNK